MQEYLDRIRSTGLAVNMIPLVRHSNIRAAGMGYRTGQASPEELAVMKRVLQDCFDAGAIDGVSTSSSSGVDGKFWEFLSFASDFNWHCASDMVTVNLEAWNRLTPKQRDAIETTAREMEPLFWLNAINEDIESIKVLTDKGLNVTEPSETLKAQLNEKSEVIWKGFMARNPQAKPVIEGYQTVLGR